MVNSVIEADARGVFAQQTRADGVERAGPRRESTAAAASGASFRASSRSTRRVSSAAARREKVASMIRFGSAPARMSAATRCASVAVLPAPAPAMTSSGPGPPGSPEPVFDCELLRLVEVDGRLLTNQGEGHGVDATSFALCSQER